MAGYNGLERRSGHERRKSPIPFYRQLSFKGQRKTLRRAADRKRITLLDWYHPSMLVSILAVLGLSLLDALLTLILIEKGARELNPVMRYYVDHGPTVSVLVKYGITALALFIMLVLGALLARRWRFTSLLIPLSGVLFGSVVIWELYLLAVSRAA